LNNPDVYIRSRLDFIVAIPFVIYYDKMSVFFKILLFCNFRGFKSFYFTIEFPKIILAGSIIFIFKKGSSRISVGDIERSNQL